MSNFSVGQKIICINDIKPERATWEFPLLFPNWVKKGDEYTVREILYNNDIVVGILLEELRNPLVYQKLLGKEQESAFATWRFAPLITDESESEEAEKAVEELLDEVFERERERELVPLEDDDFRKDRRSFN